MAAPVLSAEVEQAWSVQQAPPGATGHKFGALTIDGAGNAYVASYSYYPTSTWDLILTKYDATGAHLWQTRTVASSDRDFALAVSVQGESIFVAGTAFNESGDGAFQTVKYNTAGEMEWTRRYNGPGNGSDYVVAMATDYAGNVIVGGNSPGQTGGVDLTVVKFDAAGNQLWVFRYDGPGQNDDRLAGLKIDAQGNICLAGTSPDVCGRSAIATIKLNAAGQQVWASRFLSTSDAWQSAVARGLAIDAAGNVITVGDAERDFLTLKHSPAGNLLWSARYHAEEPASMSAVDVRVDGANNVVTAGNLYGLGTKDPVLVKYNPTGQQLWAVRVPHPVHAFHLAAIDMDSQGNTYLTGTPHDHAFTVKIGANGNQLWSIEYNSEAPLYDYGEAIKVDATGNVFIAGRSHYFTTPFVSVVQYHQTPSLGAPVVSVTPTNRLAPPGANVTFGSSPTGTGPLHYQWRFAGRPILGATDPSLTLTNVQPFNRGDYSVTVSNAAGTTVSPEARLTILLTPVVSVLPSNQIAILGAQAGFSVSFAETAPFDYYWRGTEPLNYQWRHEAANISGATNAVLRIADLVSSDAGNYSVVVNNLAGSVTSSVVSLTVSATIEQLQALRYRGPDSPRENKPLITITAAGETVVAGASQGVGTGTDIVVLKYGTNDQLLWSARYNREAAEPDVPSDLVLDLAGNIYITGYSGPPYVDRFFTTLKYSPEGEELWVRHFIETNAIDSFATSIALDPAGNVTVAGRAAETPLVVRYDGDGAELWFARGEDSLYEQDQTVVVNAAGESYLGASVYRNGGTDYFLHKFNSSGAVLWSHAFDTGGLDIFATLAMDHAGNILVAGSSYASFNATFDAVVFKYAPDGTRIWSTNFGGVVTGEGIEEFHARALIVDRNDSAFVVAAVENDDDDRLGTVLAKLDSTGHLLWTAREPDLEVFRRTRVAVDDSGNAHVTGTTFHPATGNDAVTVKYDSSGNRLWRADYAAAGLSVDSGSAVAADSRGGVYVTGEATALTGQGTDLILLHYRQQDRSGTFRIGLMRQSDGSFRFSIPPGAHFDIEASSDLIQWSSPSEGEINDLLQLRTTNAWRFYRLVLPTGF